MLASEYRGKGGGEGREELGGTDVNDVLSLFPLAHNLGYVDRGNVFMAGVSRGEMQTLLALKLGVYLPSSQPPQASSIVKKTAAKSCRPSIRRANLAPISRPAVRVVTRQGTATPAK